MLVMRDRCYTADGVARCAGGAGYLRGCSDASHYAPPELRLGRRAALWWGVLGGTGKPPSADFKKKKSADELLRKRRRSGTLARRMNVMKGFATTVGQPRRRPRAAGTMFLKKNKRLCLQVF